MTFSDAKVAALVNANFVAAWINRGAGFHNEDYAKEKWIFGSAMEAYPTKNICTFFMTPDGDVFHYVAGYFAPAAFRAEVETALEIRRAAFDASMMLKPGGLTSLARLHADAAARIESQPTKPDATPVSYRTFKHEHSDACARAAREGDRYRQALHEYWSRLDALPTFEKIRLDYVYGDPFTEEPRRCDASVAGRWITRREE